MAIVKVASSFDGENKFAAAVDKFLRCYLIVNPF